MAARYPTVAEIREIAAELEEIPDGVLEVWAGVARNWINVARWGESASEGHRQLAAHLVSLAPDGLGVGIGVPTSSSVGPVSVSDSVPSADEVLNLTATTHGQVYLAVRQLVASTGTALVSNTRIRLG